MIRKLVIHRLWSVSVSEIKLNQNCNFCKLKSRNFSQSSKSALNYYNYNSRYLYTNYDKYSPVSASSASSALNLNFRHFSLSTTSIRYNSSSPRPSPTTSAGSGQQQGQGQGSGQDSGQDQGPPDDPDGPSTTSTPRERVIEKITEKKIESQSYLFIRLQKFFEGYGASFEKKFPTAINIYRVFVVGFKDFTREAIEYTKLRRKFLMNGSIVLKDMDLRQLTLLYRMKRDLGTVGPVMVLALLPLAQYIVFPFAYLFPKYMLSSHFWSIGQKAEFAIDFQIKRQSAYRPILQNIQAAIDELLVPELKSSMQGIADKLGSGMHPSHDEIMKVKILFEGHNPFSITGIYGAHARALCKAHRISGRILFRRSRLYEQAELIMTMDKLIAKIGVKNLKLELMKESCFLRGFNASNTTVDSMTEFLSQWISISSTKVDENAGSGSLVLHLPVLLAYNSINNWALLPKQ